MYYIKQVQPHDCTIITVNIESQQQIKIHQFGLEIIIFKQLLQRGKGKYNIRSEKDSGFEC